MRYGRGTPAFAVNLVGPTMHIANAPPGATANFLVAIGMHLDTEEVRNRLDARCAPAPSRPPWTTRTDCADTVVTAFERQPAIRM